MKSDKFNLLLLFINIIYLIIFTIIFLKRSNIEFLIYVGAIIVAFIIIGIVTLKIKISKFSLIGLSLVGFLHMLGGALIINGLRLYAHYLVFGLIKYDLIIHFLGIFFSIFLIYDILKNYLEINKINNYLLFLILFFTGLGIGAFHEIIEFILVLILPETGVGGYENTMWDLVANSLGALVGFIMISMASSSK